jgi:NAD-dependent SIR2 family protein deacetylase
MHGRLLDVLCTSEESCGHSELVPRSPICAALGGTDKLVESGVIEPTIDPADLPHCTKCGALARPGVVWFGETPRHLPIIHKLVDQADLCLVVGTSSTVSVNMELLHRTRLRKKKNTKTIGVSCCFLCRRSAETWWQGRDIQFGKEQRGRGCRFLVSWAVRGNHSRSSGPLNTSTYANDFGWIKS